MILKEKKLLFLHTHKVMKRGHDEIFVKLRGHHYIKYGRYWFMASIYYMHFVHSMYPTYDENIMFICLNTYSRRFKGWMPRVCQQEVQMVIILQQYKKVMGTILATGRKIKEKQETVTIKTSNRLRW
jgi:hypothetical protein